MNSLLERKRSQRVNALDLYRYILPETCIDEILIPQITGSSFEPKRISPDGKYLICFSSTSLLVFKLKNVTLTNCKKPPKYDDFFSHHFTWTVNDSEWESINSDFCIMFKGFVIIAVFEGSTEDWDHISLNVFELETGRQTFKKVFEEDSSMLCNNSCVHLYNDWFGFCDTLLQVISIMKITDSGKLIDVVEISSHDILNDFTQKRMEELYRMSKSSINANLLFHYNYFHLQNMIVWKFQFLDESHIFLKLSNYEAVRLKQAELQTQLVHFLVYNFQTEQVICIFDNTNEELLLLYQNYMDYIRGNTFNLPQSGMTSCANNIFEREALEKQLKLYREAKNGGHVQAVRRVLSTLPIPPQTFQESPYFYQNLFSFDEKAISAVDRPRSISECVKFYCRKTGRFKFKLLNTNFLHGKSTIIFIFHPFYPFIITYQPENPHQISISFQG